MSFYTALTGLNGSQADISASSNNIANVGTTGFKRSRAEFGDIFATSPLQNSSSSIGSGAIIKGVKQQFTQGNIASSLNALDLAISGQGFFCLKPSLTSSQTVYTRNGSFNVDNNRNVVDSSGQFLLTYPVNDDGSVTAKDLDSAIPLQLPVTSGAPQATSNIDLAVNLDSGSVVVPEQDKFAGGYSFDPNDPDTFTNSTSLTIFDDLGNPTIATVYFIKTQSSADSSGDGNNKFDTRLVINDTIIDPNLVPSVADDGKQIFIDRFGKQLTEVPDDNYFLEGKGSILYKLDDLNQHVPSEPARLTGAASSFDFGEEGNNLVEVVNDPMLFNATREAGNTGGNMYWGNDFLLVSVDDADDPVSVDLRPGKYNAEQLAAEVERAINEAYGDDRKMQVRSNVDDKLTIDLFTLGATGSLAGLATPITVDLLTESYVTQQRGIDVNGASPDFLKDEFLAHAQLKINDEMNSRMEGVPGAAANQFARALGDPIVNIQESTEIFDFNYNHRNLDMDSLNITDPEFTIAFKEGKLTVTGVASTASTVTFQVGLDGREQPIKLSVTSGQTAATIAANLKEVIDGALGTSAGADEDGVSTAAAAVVNTGAVFTPTPLAAGAVLVPGTTSGVTQIPSSAGYPPQYVTVTTTNNTQSGNLVIRGVDADGVSITETITVPSTTASGDTVKTTGLFASITDITASTIMTVGVGISGNLALNGAAATATTGTVMTTRANGAIDGDLGIGRFITFKSTANETGTMTINGFDENGSALTESITLSGTLGTTVTSLKAFSKVTAITPSAGTAGSVSVGVTATNDAYYAKDNGDGSLVIGRTEQRFMIHSYYGQQPALEVYDKKVDVSEAAIISYEANNNVLEIPIGINSTADLAYFAGKTQQTIKLAGTFAAQANVLNGRELKILGVDLTKGTVRIDTTNMGFPEADFETTGSNAFILSDVSKDVESFFEGADIAPEGSTISFNNKRIVMRETGKVTHAYDNNNIKGLTSVNIQPAKSPAGTFVCADPAISLTFNEATGAVTVTGTVGASSTTVRFDLETPTGPITITTGTIAASATSADIATAINTALGSATLPAGVTASVSGNVITIADTNRDGIFSDLAATIGVTASNTSASILTNFGLSAIDASVTNNWVDEKNPPVTIAYDSFNQVFAFGVNHTSIGPGTDSNFRAIKISGDSTADGTNNLGVPDPGSAQPVTIGSATSVLGKPFVADGQELQISAKRFGIDVKYNSDTQTFAFSSGTTGESVPASGADSVITAQPASNIQVGRYAISAVDGSVINTDKDSSARSLAAGDSHLMGHGASKSTFFEAPRGLQALPAVATGASANEPLNEIFAMSDITGDTTFNISINGVAGLIKVPAGNYIGATLASELQTRINQIADTATGVTVGGVTVKYQAATNNFTFTTGTTSDASTIKVKGAARFGLDDVALGVGSVPEITNLVQATNADGVPLYVDENGVTVTNPPNNLVEDFFPLYLDEGELTFSKSGEIVSPKNKVRYEQQASGFSISLDMDYSASTQLATPFAVNNLNQDGFTSGRLDGLEIDATGLLRANYTNGQNKPLGKLVMANFNNQNGLKQVGNATYVETAVSGTPTVGEAGSEGFGSIQSGSLERSNVDITEELVNLITAQRNFQASSKAIETSTQLTQTIIQIRS